MVKIDSLSHDGRGVARIEGKTVFVAVALPNETVDVRYYKRHKAYDEAICDTVLVASSHREIPRCTHFSSCGGCVLQHISSEFQHSHKQSVLLEQLQHFGLVQPDFLLPPLYDESPWGYRFRARLSARFSDVKKTMYVGFREKTHARRITEMHTCDILIPAVGEKIDALRVLLDSLEAKQHISQIEIAAGDEACALIFRHMIPLSTSDREKLLSFGLSNSFWIILQGSTIDKLEWLLPEVPTELFYRLTNENLIFYFHPAHFTQVNPTMNQKLVHRALALLNPQSNETILDLFCGLGNFSLPIAKRAKSVVGVEGSQAMVKQAEYNAKKNSITNAYFHVADLNDIAFRNASWVKHGLGYDKILLDPSRAGALEIVQSMDQWNPKAIVYVSCNPATLARDAGILVQQKGYRLSKAGIADMFPHTSHVESIALFERL